MIKNPSILSSLAGHYFGKAFKESDTSKSQTGKKILTDRYGKEILIAEVSYYLWNDR